MEAWPRSRLALADFLAGDWDSALRIAGDVIELGNQYGDHRGRVSSRAMYAWLLVHRGRLSEAREYLDRAVEIGASGRGPDSPNMSVVVASTTLALAEGKLSLAVEIGAPLTNLTIVWYPIVAVEPLGVALAASGQSEAAAELTGRLRSLKSCSTQFPTAVVDSLAVFDRLGAARHANLARDLLRGLGTTPSRGRPRRANGTPLSTRELEVARMVASGRSNADVATELFISPRTVTTHLDRIYARLGLNSRVALTRYLADSGLLDEGGPDR